MLTSVSSINANTVPTRNQLNETSEKEQYMKELEKVAVDNVINVQDEKGCERIRLNREYFTPFTPFIPCGTQMRHLWVSNYRLCGEREFDQSAAM